MLGPAMKDLLQTLAADKFRTPQQTELFEELALLAAASPEPITDPAHAVLGAEFRSSRRIEDEFGILSVTRPGPKGGPGTCRCCGQPLPPSTLSGV
jgi:hypothetical protein